MKKIYHLGNCTTCQRIMKEFGDLSDFEVQDIKTEPITSSQIEHMAKMAGKYENLFSRRAMKYRGWGLHDKSLTEKDYKKLILKEYTFLKRPVVIVNERIFVGNAPKVVAEAKDCILMI